MFPNAPKKCAGAIPRPFLRCRPINRIPPPIILDSLPLWVWFLPHTHFFSLIHKCILHACCWTTYSSFRCSSTRQDRTGCAMVCPAESCRALTSIHRRVRSRRYIWSFNDIYSVLKTYMLHGIWHGRAFIYIEYTRATFRSYTLHTIYSVLKTYMWFKRHIFCFKHICSLNDICLRSRD